jgi:hypothetical protein
MGFKSDTKGLDRLIARVQKIERPDARTLMATWMRVIEEDNRRGVLAGLDKNGAPMPPVTYRPKMSKPPKLTLAQKNTNSTRARRGTFGGFGPMSAGLNNNLTSAEYRKLDGPPLAPRRQFSRVITNLVTGYAEPSGGGVIWEAFGVWREVVSRKGVHFLPFHFEGRGRLMTRDLSGVRPEGRAKARKASVAWMSYLIRGLPVSRIDAA